MASSSSSAPSSQSPKKYDVFISFRGEDTRFNFTSHLHEALRRNQIDTYIDYRLEKGDEVWPSLEKAIEDSTLFLVIFSENYASSTWCLKELAKILECSKNQGCFVMPVFYRVDPSHVRKQSWSYERAFEEHERKRNISNQQLQKWREALTQAANLSGWHCSFNRDEAELIKEIVNQVMQKLGPRYQSEYYLKGLIGIHKRMADVESLLDKGSNNGGCQFIGIWGMGGLGKTTLAEALFNKLLFTYEGFCFLNVREESKKYGMDALRRELLWRLLGDKESHIGNAIYPHTIISRLRQKKVLIVLDDVDDVQQLENLVGRCEFGLGSKILITTRDRQVLACIKVVDMYALDCLNQDEAFDLFYINTFRNDYADLKIRKLAQEVTEYAGGNPLALKGGIEGMIINLSEVEEMWVIIKAFDSMPNLKLLKVYGDLNGQPGNKLNASGMKFLSRNLVLLDWVRCPLESLPATLKAESLVRLEMPFSRLTRLWDGVQNLVNLSKIMLRQSKDLIELSDFSKATRLEKVDLERCSKLRSVHPSILSLHSLRALLLHGCTSLTSLKSDTHLQSLILLDASYCSSLEEFSVTSENEDLCLHLSGTAISGALRSSSGHRSKIRSLFLFGCGNVTSVHKLIKLRDLRNLDAGGCNELASRLLFKCDKMGALESPWLAYCNELSELPNDIRLLSSLRFLDLSLSRVQTLPSSIKHFSRLQCLRLDGCKRLRCLPELPPSILQLIAPNCISLETIQYSPLTKEGEEGKDKACPLFLFTNCKKLNRRSIKDAEARVLLGIKKATYDYARLEYPGKRVPRWLMYRDKGSSVSVNLSSIPNSEDGGFIFCAVFSKLPSAVGENIDAKWFIDGKYACRAAKRSLYLGPPWFSKDVDLWHVVLWCVPDSLGELKRKIEERKRNGQSNMELKVKFEVRSDHDRITEIKRCGVCPTSAVEYQDGDIKQIQLPLPHQPGSNAMEAASRKRKYRS
ncbi:TMV resistance protein N-like [Neltuma alba]|uniref:TMV resistance protein N-like n=1 Tax=Neltuma alba TaxID=207710 RepID=UPI0010A3FC4F|nr:TMV resistance protein N-like [Prosopis alba]